MLNENEIYSCNQLEAFSALPSVEKLKVKKQSEQPQTQSQPQATVPAQEQPLPVYLQAKKSFCNGTIAAKQSHQLDKVKLELDANGGQTAAQTEKYLRSSVAQTASPKTVTASVFKTIPIAAKLRKGNTAAAAAAPAAIPIVGARAPQSVTASLIQPISSIKRDLGVRLQPPEKPIAEPSFIPRQTVVTASLFQPRANAPGILTTKPFDGTETTMNKSYLMFANDIRQLTSEYIPSPHFAFFVTFGVSFTSTPTPAPSRLRIPLLPTKFDTVTVCRSRERGKKRERERESKRARARARNVETRSEFEL